MRIKFNDKIYRLKEIESGVDSLMELVEEPKYKHGDFLVSKGGHPFILDRKGRNGESHYLFAISIYNPEVKFIQDSGGKLYCGYLKDAVLADQEATEAIRGGLKSMGKFWNADKKCIEDIPVYRSGDILVKEYKTGSEYIFILDRISEDGTIHYHCYHSPTYHRTEVKPDFGIGRVGDIYHKCLRYAEDSEKELLFAKLSNISKRWNDDKKCIEDISQQKFKVGDKVTLKSGCTSKPGITYCSLFDEYIGRELKVIRYTLNGYVYCGNGYYFHEDWLEPWSDEPKVGDWVIYWDYIKEIAHSGVLTGISTDGEYKYIVDNGTGWKHAVKWNGTKEHLEKIRSGKV